MKGPRIGLAFGTLDLGLQQYCKNSVFLLLPTTCFPLGQPSSGYQAFILITRPPW